MSTEDRIDDILRTTDTIAVVGCSRHEEKDAHKVPAFMKEMGYNIIPVNPHADEVLGQPAFDNLIEAFRNTGVKIDLVDVFRPSEELPRIVEETVVVEPDVLWTQLGINDEKTLRTARDRGIEVVADRCLLQEYQSRFNQTPRTEI